ncbi:hypothetical protein M153_100082713 [Pseudoloma neurophilia]|uniref:Uncharacterized protein n=1 Tax=Pseudoloma neurophilia TaxID=146866 RepID=A0A0R0M1D2_9MICR|nr:hypothetical protein M153_100082713 [Pseudoloma neurophilia]
MIKNILIPLLFLQFTCTDPIEISFDDITGDDKLQGFLKALQTQINEHKLPISSLKDIIKIEKVTEPSSEKSDLVEQQSTKENLKDLEIKSKLKEIPDDKSKDELSKSKLLDDSLTVSLAKNNTATDAENEFENTMVNKLFDFLSPDKKKDDKKEKVKPVKQTDEVESQKDEEMKKKKPSRSEQESTDRDDEPDTKSDKERPATESEAKNDKSATRSLKKDSKKPKDKNESKVKPEKSKSEKKHPSINEETERSVRNDLEARKLLELKKQEEKQRIRDDKKAILEDDPEKCDDQKNNKKSNEEATSTSDKRSENKDTEQYDKTKTSKKKNSSSEKQVASDEQDSTKTKEIRSKEAASTTEEKESKKPQKEKSTDKKAKDTSSEGKVASDVKRTSKEKNLSSEKQEPNDVIKDEKAKDEKSEEKSKDQKPDEKPRDQKTNEKTKDQKTDEKTKDQKIDEKTKDQKPDEKTKDEKPDEKTKDEKLDVKPKDEKSIENPKDETKTSDEKTIEKVIDLEKSKEPKSSSEKDSKNDKPEKKTVETKDDKKDGVSSQKKEELSQSTELAAKLKKLITSIKKMNEQSNAPKKILISFDPKNKQIRIKILPQAEISKEEKKLVVGGMKLVSIFEKNVDILKTVYPKDNYGKIKDVLIYKSDDGRILEYWGKLKFHKTKNDEYVDETGFLQGKMVDKFENILENGVLSETGLFVSKDLTTEQLEKSFDIMQRLVIEIAKIKNIKVSEIMDDQPYFTALDKMIYNKTYNTPTHGPSACKYVCKCKESECKTGCDSIKCVSLDLIRQIFGNRS